MRNKLGFTLVEILISIAVLGILSGIAAMSLFGLQKQLNLESAAQTLSQDIQSSRARSLSTSNSWRLRITSTNGYVLEEETGNTWTVRKTVSLGGVIKLTNVSVGDSVSFDTRGFATFNLGGSALGEIRVTDSSRTLRVLPSMVGAVRVVKL
ncbi:MAG: prepilin-type N-terminal cleavage/methylation domain-containing protein [Deinococcus sp.]|nr:prepilin-type N-terminal cleavage/methylation domain-containing protein [Deinococcus sp.]